MEYRNIKQATFINRPNRFIANIEIDGNMEICHVKNTGRCKELLIPGAKVFVQVSDSKTRKTKYDLIAVYKGNKLVNIDSQVPNKVFYEWLLKSNLIKNITTITPEAIYGQSRFDFYIETGDSRKIFIEVKGVTLEEDGVAMFPDAPTERGVKHITELCYCIDKGYEAYIVFIVQLKDVLYFTPNDATHKAFGDALRTANNKGVNVIALDTWVTENSISVGDYVDVKL